VNIAEIIGFVFAGLMNALSSPFISILFYLIYTDHFVDEISKTAYLFGSVIGTALHYSIIIDAICGCKCRCEEEKENNQVV